MRDFVGALFGLTDRRPEEWPDLSDRSWRVLHMRFVDGLTLDQIAKELGPPITRERVRQIESKSLSVIRWWIRDAYGPKS